MYEAINSIFISLIPKVDSPNTFNDFKPISLFKFLYNIIANIITNCLKLILYNHIFPDQFSSLYNPQIHEAIGTTQEALHSIKIKQSKGVILKNNLSKDFDWVS